MAVKRSGPQIQSIWRQRLPHLIPAFKSLPIAVLVQEAHLPIGKLDTARALVHRHLPAYTLFAGRKQKGSSQSVRVQVVTLVHV